MKIRELKNFLELHMDEARAGQMLATFSHWVNAVFQAKEFEARDPKDIESLRKLAELKVVDIREEGGRAVASLNTSGRELYQDFYGHGYY